MKELKNVQSIKNIQDVKNYYINCWLNRFEEGHNKKSHAMHFGIFKDDNIDNDEAKIQTNVFLADFLEISKDEQSSFVDLGCGIGGTSIFFAENFPNLSVYGVNISEEQIDVAKQIASEKTPNGDIHFLLGNYCNTNLNDSSFEYAIAVESIWHAEDKRDVFNEAFRILKTSGKFVFIDYFQTRDTENDEEKILLKQFNNGWGAYEEGTGSIKTFSQKYENDLENIGFSNVESISLLKAVYKGISNSYDKALLKLKDSQLSDDLEKHYKACISLKLLADKGIIDYRTVKAVK